MNKKNTLIFKYCNFDSAEKIVTTRAIKFSNPGSFNDPFDCDLDLLEFKFDGACEEVKAEVETMKSKLISEHGDSIKEAMESLHPELLEELYKKSAMDKIERSRVCCFSKKMDNTIMWSHYADKHNGICLIFDLECEDPFTKYPPNKITQGYVSYDSYKPYNYLQSKVDGIRNLFLTKSGDWEYEDEYRYIILDGHEMQEFKPEFLNGIIFGVTVRNEQIVSFKKLCSENNLSHLKFYKCEKRKLDITIVVC